MQEIPKYEQEWIEEIRLFELKLATSRLKNAPFEQIIEQMSHRLVNKIIHPLTKHLSESQTIEYDPVKSKQEYMDNYFNKFNRPADHID